VPEAAQQPLLAVKVELEQLVLSILDDRSVSRVMREASSSSTVKSTIEQSLSSPSPSPSPAAPSAAVTAPTLAWTTPLFPLPRLDAGNAYINLRLAAAAVAGAGAGDDACKVVDVMLKPACRNLVLLGDAGPDTVLKEAVWRIPTAGSLPSPG
jgi:hypothetical protein